MDKKQRVVVLGASPKPERYSNRVVRLLLQHGHAVIPVHPTATSIEGLPVVNRLEDVGGPVDTLTVYVSAHKSSRLEATLLNLHPTRVIFNPGADNPELQHSLVASGIHVENACTLVLLTTNQF